MIHLTKQHDGRWLVLILDGGILGLESLPRRLRALLESPDFADRVVQRLFPPAYRDDEEAEREYRRLLGPDLFERKLACLESFERSVAGARKLHTESGLEILQLELTHADLDLWLGFLHDIRVAIGTALDISDDDWNRDLRAADPQYEEMLLLDRLSHLEHAILDALSHEAGFDAGEDDGDDEDELDDRAPEAPPAEDPA